MFEKGGDAQEKLFLTPCAAEGVKGTPQLSRMKAKNGQVWLSNNVIDVAEVNAR